MPQYFMITKLHFNFQKSNSKMLNWTYKDIVTSFSYKNVIVHCKCYIAILILGYIVTTLIIFLEPLYYTLQN